MRAKQRAWLEDVMRRTKKSPTQIATASGVSSTTLTRFLNNDEMTTVLSPMTISQIVQSTGIPGPIATDAPPEILAVQEEAERFDALSAETESLRGFVRAYLDGSPNKSAWVLRSDALLLQGYMPGDVLLIDMVATPNEGDIVCAQLYGAGDAETVFRVYQQPYIIAAPPPGTNIRPELVDGIRVRIVGVMTDMLRERRGQPPHRAPILAS